MRTSARSEIRVLPKNASILFVDANGVLDFHGLAIMSTADAVQVFDGTKAIAAELKTVGEHAHAVFAHIEREFSGLYKNL